MFQTKVVEKIKVDFMFNIFCSESRDVYEIIWINIVELDGPQMIIRRIFIAY